MGKDVTVFSAWSVRSPSAIKLERVSASDAGADHLSAFPTAAGSSDLSLQTPGPLSQARKLLDHSCSLLKFISSCVMEVLRHSRILLANGWSMPLAALLSLSVRCAQTFCNFSTRNGGLQSQLIRLSLPPPPPCFGRVQCLVKLSTGNILFRIPYTTSL